MEKLGNRQLLPAPREKFPCVSVIGMAGAGKTTVGSLLAKELDWAFIDTDNLLEALYGRELQQIADVLSKREFIDIEGKMIGDLSASRTVIATGGSAIYSSEATRRLATLGPVVYLKVSLETALERIAKNPRRGLALNPGESVEDLFRERERLYERAATIICDADRRSPEDCAKFVKSELERAPDFKIAG